MNPKRAETKAERMAIYRAKQALRPKPKKIKPRPWRSTTGPFPTPLSRQDLKDLFCL